MNFLDIEPKCNGFNIHAWGKLIDLAIKRRYLGDHFKKELVTKGKVAIKI